MPKLAGSVADPHNFDADPDPYSACQLDPDTDPVCHLDSDTDPACHFDTDPDPNPTIHFDADPYPSFQISALFLGLYSIHFGLSFAKLYGFGSSLLV